jgi:hypothetical protein
MKVAQLRAHDNRFSGVGCILLGVRVANKSVSLRAWLALARSNIYTRDMAYLPAIIGGPAPGRAPMQAKRIDSLSLSLLEWQSVLKKRGPLTFESRVLGSLEPIHALRF